jgi:hypothetical protein
MSKVEFQTTIKNGVIEIPPEHRENFTDHVRVVLCSDEVPRVTARKEADAKIEITKLYSIFMASRQIEHAARDATGPQVTWKPFAPTRFIYAYFAFNSLYSIDWKQSATIRKAVQWVPDEAGRLPKEEKQFRELLRFVYDLLDLQTPSVFAAHLQTNLISFGVDTAISELDRITSSNETEDTKGLRKAFPSNFKHIMQETSKANDHLAALTSVLRFIYKVRNNVFHGSKSRIQMLDSPQQQRLLIYTAVLVAVGDVFFEAIQQTSLGWKPVPVDLGL